MSTTCNKTKRIQLLDNLLLILLILCPVICNGKFILYNNILNKVKREVTNDSTILKQFDTDSLTKRQVYPAPLYAPPACGPGGCSAAACVLNRCACPPGALYNPVGCAPTIPAAIPSLPAVPAFGAPLSPPPPIPAGRLIPQALPGAPCEPGVECTGGSVCSMGICLCPPELVQEGTVCVSRTVYGVLPPPPPPGGVPIAPPPPAYAAFQPPIYPAYSSPAYPAFAPLLSAYPQAAIRAYQPAPLPPPPLPPSPPPLPLPAPLSVSGPCGPGGCMPGAFCDSGFCSCGPTFSMGFGGSCIHKSPKQPGAFSVDVADSDEEGSK